MKLRVDDPKEWLYCLTVSGEELSIGNERIVRLDGLEKKHSESCLRKQVAKAMDLVKTPVQYAGLVVLYDFYSQYVYPPAILRDKGFDSYVEGFTNAMCTILDEESRKMLSEVSNFDTSKLVARLEGNFGIWSDEIEGSVNDVYENEIGKSHMSKRILKREFFQVGWLEQRFGLNDKNKGNEPPSLGKWWVALDGQKNGPHDEHGLSNLIAVGRMVLATKVWKKGMSGWVPVEQVKELDSLFNQPPPLDDKPSPVD